MGNCSSDTNQVASEPILPQKETTIKIDTDNYGWEIIPKKPPHLIIPPPPQYRPPQYHPLFIQTEPISDNYTPIEMIPNSNTPIETIPNNNTPIETIPNNNTQNNNLTNTGVLTNDVYFKCVASDYTHHNFKYKLGYNKDILPFNNKEDCVAGGLYFTNRQYIKLYEDFGPRLAIVRTFQDSQVVNCGTKFKSDKIYIDAFVDPANIDRIYIDNPSDNDIAIFPLNIQKKVNPTYNQCLLAVSINGLVLKYIPKHLVNNELITCAVKQNGLALQYVDYNKKTDEICRLAIIQNPNALQFTDFVC
jgi:hypothetical protein